MAKGLRSKAENKFLKKLVQDCITYRLHENEALEYIEKEFGEPLSKSAYYDRRAKLQSPSANKAWINWFSRIGFVQLHQKQIDDMIMILQDSFQTLHKLTHQNILGKKARGDEYLILKLKEDIRESEHLLAEFGMGMPIIAAVKKRIEDAYAYNQSRSGIENNKSDHSHGRGFNPVDSYKDWYSQG
jgi:hypothetical protein